MAASINKKILDNVDPKYRRIAAALREKIISGQYAPGQRLPSESALVRRHGVSRPTAARALQDLVNAGLVERRAGSGSFVSDQPKLVAGGQTLGLLIPQWRSTEILESICGQLASLARARGIDMVWANGAAPAVAQDERIESDAAQADRLCEDCVGRKLSGVFFAPLELSKKQAEVNHRIVSRLMQAGIATVLIDRDIERFPQRSALDLSTTDNFAAGHLLAAHLLKLGCRRIAFFTRPLSASTVAGRISGVREALVRNGVANWDSVIEGDPADASFVKARLVRKNWDACICANDRTAVQLMQTLLRLGVRVPRDLRVAGFDDAKYATLVAVPLTTVHQPCDEIASLAFEAMLRRIANPLAVPCAFLAAPRLVVRESCGTYLPR